MKPQETLMNEVWPTKLKLVIKLTKFMRKQPTVHKSSQTGWAAKFKLKLFEMIKWSYERNGKEC